MNDSSGRLGLAIIGHGMASKPHAKSLVDLADWIEVRGVYSRSPERRAAFAAEYGFPVADSIDALANDPAVGAVLIMTPPNARAEMVERFASAGKHILMEKPVERTSAAAEAIVETCWRNGVELGIVFQHRFREGSLKLKEMIEAGVFGNLVAARLAVPWWRPQAYYDEPGRGTLARDGGGVLISQAIHAMDLMLSLTGPVARVQAVAGTTPLHRMETEDFVAGGLHLVNGAIGSIVATSAAFPGDPESINLDFERAAARLQSGTLTVRWQDGRTETFGEEAATGGGADPMAFPHDWHRGLIADFADAVTSGREPMVTGKQALNVHYLIDALLASARDERAVDVKQVGA